MQKYLKMLEENVEWVALGIGAIFVFLMLWTYVFQTPVEVTVAGQPRSPGKIDELITEPGGPATRLESAIISDARLPQIPVFNFRQEIVDELAFGKFRPPMLPAMAFHVLPTPAMGFIDPNLRRLPVPDGVNQPIQMAKLPKPPIAVYVNHSKGRSTVNMAPLNQTGMGGVIQPGGMGSVNAKDVDWVSLTFNVDPALILKEYQACNIDRQLFNQSIFLTVELVREELLDASANKWSESVPVKPLATVQLQQFPGDRAAQAQAFMFEQWAQKNQPDILQPAFYPVLNGDKWWHPGSPNPNEIAPPPQPVVQPPPEEPRPRGRQPRTPRNTRRNENEGMIPDAFDNRAPLDPDRPMQLAQVIPDAFESDRGGFNYPGGDPGGFQAPGVTPANVPPGNFDPAAMTNKFEIRAHDDSVKAGHTYRYKLRYRLKNPAYGQPRLTDQKKPELSSTFAVQSDDSVVTPPINIISRVNFFVVGNKAAGNKVTFEVFKWENGQQRSKFVDVTVGDMVGAKDASADFTTGWTVVDVRGDNKVVHLIDEQGRTERRSLDTDRVQFKELMERLRQEVQRANTAAAAGAPGQPPIP